MEYPTVPVTGDPVPSDGEVHIGVEVVNQFTASSPAELRIEFTNEAPTKREFDFNTVAPIGPLVGHSEAGARIHATRTTAMPVRAPILQRFHNHLLMGAGNWPTRT